MNERGQYRPIYERLWDGPDFQALKPPERLVLLALKGKCGCAGIRCIAALVGSLVEWTGFEAADVEKALQVLETSGWIVRDRNIVWVIRGLEFEPAMSAENPKHRQYIQSIIDGLPSLPIVTQFCAHNSGWKLTTVVVPAATAEQKPVYPMPYPMANTETITYTETVTNTETNTETDILTDIPRKDFKAALRAVYEFWQVRTDNQSVALTKSRQQVILGRLRAGYTVEQLQTVIEWAIADPWMNGTDPKATRAYLDVPDLIGSNAKVDKYLLAAKRPGDPRNSLALRADHGAGWRNVTATRL